MRTAAVLALAAIAACCGGAAPAGAKTGPNTRTANEALSDAVTAVANSGHGCLPFFTQPAPASDDPPPAELLSQLSVLRRPAGPEDTTGDRLGGFLGGVNPDNVRRARVLPDGSAVFLLPTAHIGPRFRVRPRACLARERVALEHRLRDKPASVRRLARRLLDQVQASERARAAEPPRASLAISVRTPTRQGGAGGGDAATLVRRGIFIGFVRPHGTRRLIGVIPDGVSTIDFTFADGRRGALRRSAHVLHNVVAVSLPADGARNVFPARQVWRDASGAVIKTVGREPSALVVNRIP